jgi:chemotaxis protein histidine kinase CheA
MTESNGFNREDLEILLPIFRTSVGEHIATVRRSLQTIRRAPDDAGALTELHRAAHSVKGAALQLGFVHIGVLARAMETLAVASRERVGGVSSECGALFACGADCLERYLQALDRPGDCPSADGELLTRMTAMTARLAAETAGTGNAGAHS